MRYLSVIQVVAIAAVLAWHVAAAPAPTYAAGRHDMALEVPDKPICPERPKDPTVKWPPSWCRLPKSPRTDKKSQVFLRLLADPNSRVAPGALVAYELGAYNGGQRSAEDVQVSLPLQPALQTVVDVRFSRPDVQLAGTPVDTVDMQFGRLKPGEIVTATLLLHTSASAAEGADLSLRASARWNAGHSGPVLSNRVALTIAGSSASSATVPIQIEPAAGSAATTFALSYGGFASNERVSLWYHRPDGQVVGIGELLADAQGTIDDQLSATTLTRGQYWLVAFGQFSHVTAVGNLTIAGP
jgi:hypothetical protein